MTFTSTMSACKLWPQLKGLWNTVTLVENLFSFIFIVVMIFYTQFILRTKTQCRVCFTIPVFLPFILLLSFLTESLSSILATSFKHSSTHSPPTQWKTANFTFWNNLCAALALVLRVCRCVFKDYSTRASNVAQPILIKDQNYPFWKNNYRTRSRFNHSTRIYLLV